MFTTFDGLSATNQYLLPPTSHLVLSHPSLSDSLLLAEHDEKPYQYYSTGWTQADGRSLQGAIRLKGNDWNKGMWECNFQAVAAQVELFNMLLQAQQGLLRVNLIDRWVGGVATTRDVWLQVDRQYQTLAAGTIWWRLQFECWEV